jgi:hypothetical protein
MINNWRQSGNSYFLEEVSQQSDHLPQAIYKVAATPTGTLYLERLQDKFEFPYKIYGMESEFVKRVIKSYNLTNSNLGVLLNGIKGTGKTVTCELICNELNLPVIIVSADFSGLTDFINEIQQDVVLLFDEFEKVFPDDYRSGSKLLTVMDGALKNNYRKVFLLTTNDLHIERNLVQRPGRIRYLKTFKNLNLEAIIEIVDDKLQLPEFKADVIKFISELELITVDIVSSVIEEVNIHEEPPTAFEDIFNIQKLNNEFNIYKIEYKDNGEHEEVSVGKRVHSSHLVFTKNDIGDCFHFNRENAGEIVDVKGDNVVVVENYEDENDDTNENVVLTTYRIEILAGQNSIFYGYSH